MSEIKKLKKDDKVLIGDEVVTVDKINRKYDYFTGRTQSGESCIVDGTIYFEKLPLSRKVDYPPTLHEEGTEGEADETPSNRIYHDDRGSKENEQMRDNIDAVDLAMTDRHFEIYLIGAMIEIAAQYDTDKDNAHLVAKMDYLVDKLKEVKQR